MIKHWLYRSGIFKHCKNHSWLNGIATERHELSGFMSEVYIQVRVCRCCTVAEIVGSSEKPLYEIKKQENSND